jgi:hypothetical protein
VVAAGVPEGSEVREVRAFQKRLRDRRKKIEKKRLARALEMEFGPTEEWISRAAAMLHPSANPSLLRLAMPEVSPSRNTRRS